MVGWTALSCFLIEVSLHTKLPSYEKTILNIIPYLRSVIRRTRWRGHGWLALATAGGKKLTSSVMGMLNVADAMSAVARTV